MFKSSSSISVRTAAGVLLAVCGAAHGQFTAQFEAPTYSGSAAGVSTTGQAGWYLPPVANTTDHKVYTAAGNALNFPTNPAGCGQFDAGLAFLDTSSVLNSARTQHAVDFSAGGIWEATWDCTGHWSGALPAVNNLGSWSMQNSLTARYFQQLMSWGGAGNTYAASPNVAIPPPDHLAAADFFHIHIGFFTAASPATIAFGAPDPAWISIPVDNWVRVRVKWDFTAAQILETSIQNLTAGTPAVVTDVSSFGWFLQGGPASTNPLPTDVRFFAGGATATGGNASAWDNHSIGPVAAPVLPACPSGGCYPNCDNSTVPPILNVQDFSCFLNAFANGQSYANCDGSTTPPVLNVQDFSCFLNAFAAGCT
jgi:hypothetical protein